MVGSMEPQQAPLTGGRERILAVDDQPANLRLLQATLRSAGYDVVAVPSGEEALAVFPQVQPALVLLDVLMPGMDGFAVCDRLRAFAEGRLVPIIFLTALNDLGTQQRALESGADDLLVKPIQTTELLMRVRSLLWVSRLRTEMDRGYQLIREQRNELLRVQRQKDDLTRLVVHDLKNPLSSILINADYLEATQGPDGQDAIRDIHEAARRMHRLVQNLLDISSADDGALVPRLAPVEVTALLEQVSASMRRRLRERRQRLVLDAAPGMAPAVVDPELLRRILENLLDNCVKYAREGSVVRLQAVRSGAEGLELRVYDEGPGIPAEMRERIFDRHVRLEPARSERGHGFGLAFCRLAAEAHGGRVWVEDNPPSGSAFCVWLPPAAPPDARA